MTTVQPIVVAIDGPSGVGKSSAARAVAAEHGWAYLDTGAMYRAVSLLHTRSGLGPDDGEATAALARDTLTLTCDPLNFRIAIGPEDVTEAIRDPQVSVRVSTVATMIPVREELHRQQRAAIAAADGGIVVEGRDITSVVAPEAQVRVLLTADPAARLARRGAELGGAVDSANLADQVLRRDRDDATVSDFETPASGVTVIDSTGLTLDEVIAAINDLIPQE